MGVRPKDNRDNKRAARTPLRYLIQGGKYYGSTTQSYSNEL